MDSQTLLVLTALGTLATAIFTGWPIAQRAMDRPRPRWKATRSLRAQSMHDDGWLRVRLTNVGDGAAFAVALEALGAERVVLTNDRAEAARVESGDAVEFAVRLPRPPEIEFDPHGSWPPYEPTIEMLEGIRVRVTWNHPPYRSLRRRRTHRIDRIESSPTVR